MEMKKSEKKIKDPFWEVNKILFKIQFDYLYYVFFSN